MIGSSTRKDEVLERLSNGIAQLTSSVAWRDWLAIQSRFHRYSFQQHPANPGSALFRITRCGLPYVATSGPSGPSRRASYLDPGAGHPTCCR